MDNFSMNIFINSIYLYSMYIFKQKSDEKYQKCQLQDFVRFSPKFSLLTLKEIYGRQCEELLFRSWE